MERLSDFKPLSKLVLPELGVLECSGLIVLVGPNSSGKSQLLQDIYERLSGEPRQLVVAKEARVDKPPLDPFLKVLEAEGYFATLTDDGGTSRLSEAISSPNSRCHSPPSKGRTFLGSGWGT